MILMRRIKKWLKSPAGISIGVTLLGFALTVFYDLIKTKPVLTTIWAILQSIWRFILQCLTFQLRVWWVLLAIAGLIFVLYIAVKIDDQKHSETNKPLFLKYTKDVIMDWNWEWDWEKQYDGNYAICHLHPICPRCNTPLIHSYIGGECPRCHYSAYSIIPNDGTVKLLIRDNVKKGLFPKNENDE